MSDPLLNEYGGLLQAVEILQRKVSYLERIAAAIPGLGTSTAMVKIEEKTASASATLDFVLPSGYSYFILAIRNLKPATDAVDLWLRMSTDGGATFIATATYSYHTQLGQSTATTYAAGASTGAAQILLSAGAVVGNAADESVSGEIRLLNMESTINKKEITHHLAISTTAGNVAHSPGSGDQDTITAVDAVRILFSSGNIASGTIILYGVL